MKPEDLIIELNNKNISIGSYCTFRRTYSDNINSYIIGKLKKTKKYLFIISHVNLTLKDTDNSIKLNYDNIKYLSKSTIQEICLYKLLKMP